MRKSFIIALLLLLPCIFSIAQVRLQNEPARPSAEAWQMTRYGDAAPSLYTGTMALSVPVYTYKDPDFEIPISLDYSSNGCVPNVRAGVLGPDWSLNAGGVITREIRGFPDEQRFRHADDLVIQPHLDPMNYDITVKGYSSIYFGDSEYPNADHNSYISSNNHFLYPNGGSIDFDYSGVTARVNHAADGPDILIDILYDLEPDLFQFSVMGYSGSFILRPHNQVLVFGTNVDPNNISVNAICANAGTFTFVITTTDGYQFTFEEGDKIILHDSSTQDRPGSTATSWKLTKITAPNGRIAEFFYKIQNYVTNKRPNTILCSGGLTDGLGRDWSPYATDNSINTSDSDIAILDSLHIYSFSAHFCYDSFTENAIDDSFSDCKRLKSVDILYKSDTLKKCKLSYWCDPQSLSNVTYLTKVSISGIGEYSFEYENTRYPRYGTKEVDHWGYYNGKTSGYFLGISHLTPDYEEIFDANNSRDPDANYAKCGMLTKTTYPTGGYSVFEYEPNDYSAAITRTLTNSFFPHYSELASNKTCGGVRIKTISNFDEYDSLLTMSSYSYRLRQANVKSSGILLNSPRYRISYRATVKNSYSTYQHQMDTAEIASNNLTRMGQRDIEYSEVSETDLDGNVTQYLFSNSSDYDYQDRLVLGPYMVDRVLYASSPSLENANLLSTPTTSLKNKRGKLLAKRQYDEVGNLLKAAENTYSHSSLEDTTSFVSHPVGLIYLSQYISDYVGKSTLVSSADTSYYGYGAVKVITSHSYEYNNYGQLKAETFTDPDNHTHTTRYYYVTDIVNPTFPEKYMLWKNAINRPLRIENYVDNVLKLRTVISYEQIGGFSSYCFRESSITETDLVNNIVTTTTFQYDTKGHLIEKVVNGTHHTTYIWGYDGLYLVGIVDNCPLSTVRLLAGVSCIADNPIEATISTPDASILRGFGDFTLFDYEPFVGLTRVIEPDGKETVYNYNESGKLSSVNDAGNRKTAGYLYSPDNRLTE